MAQLRALRWDYAAVAAAAAAVACALGYARLMQAQGDTPRPWYLGGLAVAAALAVYGAPRSARRREPAVAAAGVILLILGVLGIFSVGLPLLVAGAVALADGVGAMVRRP